MNTLIADYQERISIFNQQIAKEKARLNTILYSRLAIFIAGFILFFLLVQSAPIIAGVSVILIVIIFLILLKKELLTIRKVDFLHNLIQINENEIKALNNQFDHFDQGTEFINKEHFFVADLDIFGRRSIFQLLNRTSTYSGRIRLANWLTQPFLNKTEINERQEIVKELSGKLKWNQEFIAHGETKKENQQDKNNIQDWLQEPLEFSGIFLKIIGILFPVVTLLALVLSLANIAKIDYFNYLFLLQLIIVGRHVKKTKRIHNALGRKINSIEKYNALIMLIESENFQSKKALELKQRLAANGTKSGTNILQLKKLVDQLDGRLNIVAAVLLNGIFLFDINMMRRIEAWKVKHKDDFLIWIDVIGEFDAYVSIGMYACNHPSFCFPEVETNGFTIHADDLGHPMISSKKLIKNNYVVNGIPRVDLLTGANMAGKSTFLRTIGVNLITAMIGAPVCAAYFKFTPTLLFTSLRTTDSLQENESFFYAELKRLQQLMVAYENNTQVFFLLDEILKGTNSKDQHAGSEALIKKIIHLKGVGIVATHDVELSKLSKEFPEYIRNLCFEITIENDKLHFDYKVKDGVCATMNASFLMKRMGIT